MAVQLRAVGEGVAAEGAAEVVLALLVPVLDVLLQGGVALVAAGAVGAREQLGEGVRGAWERGGEGRFASLLRAIARRRLPTGLGLEPAAAAGSRGDRKGTLTDERSLNHRAMIPGVS